MAGQVRSPGRWPLTWTMTRPGEKSGWLKSGWMAPYLDNDQAWWEVRVNGPLPGQWPGQVRSPGECLLTWTMTRPGEKSGWMAPYLDSDQARWEVRVNGPLPGQWPGQVRSPGGWTLTWKMTRPGEKSGWMDPKLAITRPGEKSGWMDPYLPGQWPDRVRSPGEWLAYPPPDSWLYPSPPVRGTTVYQYLNNCNFQTRRDDKNSLAASCNPSSIPSKQSQTQFSKMYFYGENPKKKYF